MWLKCLALILSLTVSYGLSTLTWKWNFIVSLFNLQSFLFKHSGVHFASLPVSKSLKNWDQNGVRGQAKKQRAVLSYIVLVMFVHADLGAYSRIGLNRGAHIALFARWGDSENAIKFASDNLAEAVGSLSTCLNVCLKVLLPGAGWLNVWTVVNRWIALLFWSTVSSFSFCYQVSETDCTKKDHMGTCERLHL